MPQPGQPYRPLIALPSQAASVNPMLTNCGGVSFKAWDPPRSLVPASAMVAAITTNSPLATPSIPLPSPTLDPGPEETGMNNDRPSITTPADQAAQSMASPQTAIATELPSDHIPEPEASSKVQDALPGDAESIPNDPPVKTNENVGQVVTSYPRSSPEPFNGVAPTTGGTQQASNNPSDPQAYRIGIGSQDLAEAITSNGQVAQPLSDAISIAGTRLTPGAGPITVDGTQISLGNSVLVVGSSTIPIALPPVPLIAGQATKMNGQLIQPLNNGLSIASQTLTPGAPPITISGTPISLGPSSLLIGSSSYAIALPRQSWIPGQVTTINGQVIQPLTNGAISIDGTTLSPGALPVTVSGKAISLGSSALIIGSSTMTLYSEVPGHFVATVAGQAITADPTALEIGSLKLTAGPPGISLSGTLVSLDSDGELLLGTRTITLQTTAGDLGGLIMGSFRPGGSYATSLAGLGNFSDSGNTTATGNGVQTFEGLGKSWKSSSLWKPTIVVLFATLVCLF